MKKRKNGRTPFLSPALTSTLQRVMDRRGSQRWFYHVHETMVPHWWDHEEVLNNVQYELETIFGAELVHLVSVRELPHNGGLVFCFYFRIGPIPAPDEHFPGKSSPVKVEKPVMLHVDPPSEMRL